MLRIAVCDDMPDELQILVSLTEQYISGNHVDAELRVFAQPDALLSALEAERFHIYILDIVMPMVNGVELGQEIRRVDREAQIIYTTTEAQFALQAYTASPINYLLKPIAKQQFFDALSLAISRVESTEEQIFAVKTTDGLRVVRLADIICCEYCNHAVTFFLLKGDAVTSRTFRERFLAYCAPILQDKRFLQCHTSFVVNMRWVERFSKDSFTMCGGKVVPISSRRYPAVRDAFMDYLMAKRGR